MRDAFLCPSLFPFPFPALAPDVDLYWLLSGLLWPVARSLFAGLWTRTRASHHRDASAYESRLAYISMTAITLLTRQLDLPVALLL